MKGNLLITSLLGLLLLLSACGNNVSSTDSEDEDTLSIYTSIYPLEDFTKKIGGSHVNVTTLIPPGADSHTYEPTSREVLDIAKADAFIYNGLGMESYAENIHDTLKNEDVLMVIASEGVEALTHEHNHEHEHGEEEHNHEHEHEHGEEEHDHEHEHEHGEEAHNHEHEHGHGEEEHDHEHEEGNEHEHNNGDEDPHIWLDPHRAILLAENIKDSLVNLKPDAKEEFEKNFEALKSDLEALDEQFHHLVETKENPEMIVSHAAYGYWEESYGIKQIPIAGLSSSQEPSQSELAQLIKLAKDKNFKYVIFEQNVTPKVAEVIREEINAEPLYLHNLSTLTADDLDNNEDYFSLMKRNLETLDKALQ
ncbi:metal ABC transporter solute-binding protein, Zn/Mn family [Paucisalibacillus sp. EB02]|uniref:metal ABC transporter solute-binding protein, Zn/Mn family n=1 Tax=Paucisalibacillus sp. EB02 TaxID=1347087 RepID=UPI0004B60F00|nr:zinc ABC transporter substrate-binding protein [Paucisalibacillus sp. EB02]